METPETEGAATSTTLSASWANSVIFLVSGVEARTIQMFDGSHCEKSLHIDAHLWYLLCHPERPEVAAYGAIAEMISYLHNSSALNNS